MAYIDQVSENLQNAAEKACEYLDPALITLMDLIGDSTQTGPVRIAACKTIMDYALKLDARAMGLSRHETDMDKLKTYLDTTFPPLADIIHDVDAYDEE